MSGAQVETGQGGSGGVPPGGGGPGGVPDSEVGEVVGQPAGLRVADLAVAEGRELRLEELIDQAHALGPDPLLAGLDDQGLVDRFVVHSAQLAAATARWLALLAELVVRDIWADQGARSPAQWLSWKVGLGSSTAREQVRVALRLRQLPEIRTRFEAGQLSYSKVRALTRIAVPGTEQLLLQLATHATGAQLERMASAVSSSRRATAADDRQRQARRGISWQPQHDGDVILQLRMAPEHAELFMVLTERLVALELHAQNTTDTPDPDADPAPDADVDSSDADPAPAPDADAGEGPDTAGDAGGGQGVEDGARLDDRPTPGQGHPSRQQIDTHGIPVLLAVLGRAVDEGPADTTGQDRHTLVLHVDVELLADAEGRIAAADLPVPVGRPRMPAMNVRVLRRLACQAGLVLVATNNGSPIDVGRRQQRVTVALRRAVLARDRACRFPGCGTTRHLHIHHVVHWADGGPTDLSNLVALCSYHHSFVHDHDWQLTPTGRPGRFHFAPPDGPPLPQGPEIVDLAATRPADRLPPPPPVTGDPLIPHHWSSHDILDLTSVIIAVEQELHHQRPDLTAAA